MKLKQYYVEPLVKLNEETHQYYYTQTGEIIEGPSITKLIEHLYPFDVSNIPPEALKAGIEKGVCVHNRLSYFIKENVFGQCDHKYNNWPIKTHTNEFMWIQQRLKQLKCKEIYSEVSLSNGKVNGTFDLLYLDQNNKWHLVDFKTTAKLHKDKESLQLKFYEKLLCEIFEDIEQIHYFEIYNSKHEQHYIFDQHELNQAIERMGEIIAVDHFSGLFN